MAKRKRRRGFPVVLCVLLSLLAAGAAAGYTGYSWLNEKYDAAMHPYYTSEAVRKLEPGSFEYKFAEKKLGTAALESMRAEESSMPVAEGSGRADIVIEPGVKDVNGDGIVIDHIYGGTYEGYMMIVEDPSQVFIAVNPHLGSGGPAPMLDDYVDYFDAVGGINGGGFEDVGGNGDGSIPAGIVIQGGRLISGGAPQPILGLTRDHKLVTTTASGEQALAMGVVEAVTFGPTFIENGRVVYTPTANLNMLNPRTAVGQQADGTMLLLVIDGRGPSSFGAKYEDVIEIFQKYEAVNAGNLDGGNSSVMIYNGKYVHYPVSMYNSRNLPSVVLVRGKD